MQGRVPALTYTDRYGLDVVKIPNGAQASWVPKLQRWVSSVHYGLLVDLVDVLLCL